VLCYRPMSPDILPLVRLLNMSFQLRNPGPGATPRSGFSLFTWAVKWHELT
jgi:hypothetical protein